MRLCRCGVATPAVAMAEEGVPPIDDEADAPAALRKELEAISRVSALKKRAREAGVEEQKIDDADDAENQKEALIGLILEQEPSQPAGKLATAAAAAVLETPPPPPAAILRLDLCKMRLSALQQQAKAQGVDDAALEKAEDSAKPKESIIDLIIAATPVAAIRESSRSIF